MPAQACLFLKETSFAKANLAHAPRRSGGLHKALDTVFFVTQYDPTY